MNKSGMKYEVICLLTFEISGPASEL